MIIARTNNQTCLPLNQQSNVFALEPPRALNQPVARARAQGTIRGALDGKAAEKIKAMIDKIVAAVGVPCQVFLATASSKEPGDTRKPGTGMWRKMAAECNGGVAPDLDKCFFVGAPLVVCVVYCCIT